MQGLDHSRTARAGFTLVETIVVLAVVGILAVSLVAGMDVHASVVVHEPLLLSTMYSHEASPEPASLSAILISNAAPSHVPAAGPVNVTEGGV